ncbi:MAG: hypothetical protein IJE59_04900 [Clostridia bacterium]|nr:hypothetical protein [Clostridia bacterium]
MENATDALKIAFAIFVFVIAITLTFSLISQAKSTSDYVLSYSDRTNFYEHSDSKDKNRIVSVTEVISNLYRYYKESLCVTVVLGEEEHKFDLSNTYSTTAQIEKKLSKFITDTLLKNYSDVTFKEEFVEVPVSGIYQTGEDGTQITLSSGGKKLYITYTAQ